MFALCCMSHSPLLEYSELSGELGAEIEGAFDVARAFVRDYDPDLVISFAPDHYNGFFYKLMPTCAIGLEATSIGDFGSAAGPLTVPTELAQDLAQSVLDDGIDLAVSLRMEVDHGAVQPLELLWGDISAPTIIPFFVNSVSPPFSPMARIRLLGEAVGRWAARTDQRVLLLGSGGLSHDPPSPRIFEASGDVRERMIAGGTRPPEGEQARGERLAEAAHAFATGQETTMLPLNAEWDAEFLDHVERNELAALDLWEPADITARAGRAAHEVRTWLAAYGALSVAGPYTVDYRYYRAIPELIAGFSITTARPRTAQ